MTAMSESEILADLAGILADFEGREYSGPIEPETRFFADLGLASIDAVVLGETLQDALRPPAAVRRAAWPSSAAARTAT